MTSQYDVARAFFAGENEPRRASNYQMKLLDGGATAYLVGGNNGAEMVLAKREPINQFEAWLKSFGVRRISGLYNSGGRNQVMTTRRALEDSDVDIERDEYRENEPVSTDEFPELNYHGTYVEVNPQYEY
jgi:hypothetical protein